MVKDLVVEDTEHVSADYDQYNGEYLLKEDIPVETPTRSQMHELRKQAYADTTDRLSLERMRRMAIGDWNEDRELEYQAKMAKLSAEIKAKYPFGK